MATTTNYGWTTPDDTALVKDGAAAIRTLGSSVDTTTKALNPSTTLGDIEYRSATANTNTRLGIGTTGQVLSVVGGVPAWATSDDANAIQNALLTTTGDTIYASSASTPARLGIGSTGNVLTVAGGVPTWAAPAGGGGMTLLNSGGTTLTGASINFGTISGSYNHLQLVIRNYLPATDNQDLYIRFNSDSGTNYFEKDSMASAANQTYSMNAGVLSNGSDNGVGNGLIIVDVYDYANTATLKRYDTRAITNNPTTTANLNLRMGFGVFNSTSAISGIILLPSGGNFTSGTAFLYGVK